MTEPVNNSDFPTLSRPGRGDAEESHGVQGDMPRLKKGDRIGDFEILEEIGRGGMGVVYRANEVALKRVVALKVLSPGILRDPSATKRFRREAILAANLSHPNIVPVFHIEPGEFPRYYTMEFVKGISLKDKVGAEGFLRPDQAVRIALQACEALQYAHEHGIIHRDIKPSNIILENHVERVKITDFGIAQDIGGTFPDLTQTGQLSPGTLAFESPEQTLGQRCECRSDVFSLGATLYNVLTGRLPYKGDNRAQLALAFKEQTPVPPSRFNPEIASTLDQTILWMLQTDPTRRPNSMDDVLADFRGVVERQTHAGLGTASVGTSHEPDRRRGIRSIVAGVICFALVAAGALLYVLRDNHKVVTNGIGMKLVLIPAGSFPMGSNENMEGGEKPVHRVQISKGYWLGKIEVTNGQYQQFLNQSGYQGAGEADTSYLRHHRDWARYAATGDDYPVVAVSWNNAVAFCRWLTEQECGVGRPMHGYEYRLPTEAEWEYAARGGSEGRGTEYAHPENLGEMDQIAWYIGNSGGKTHPVGQKRPNELGLHDMIGNVWEWCSDWYSEGYYACSPGVDPQGPTSGSTRVFRGGSWSQDAASGCRVTARYGGHGQMTTSDRVGFRVALAPVMNPREAAMAGSREAESSLKALRPRTDDDFEDGVINPALWDVGGSKGGFGEPRGGKGQWCSEEIAVGDGYLQATATTEGSDGGPASPSVAPRFGPRLPATARSGISPYGAQAWITTRKDYNDRLNWVLTFRWEADVWALGRNLHSIEITDGRTDWPGGLYLWLDPNSSLPGTVRLYEANGTKLGPETWSIVIDSLAWKATLHEGPDGTGDAHSTVSLDPMLPWHIRFMAVAATKGRDPSRRCCIKLYGFRASYWAKQQPMAQASSLGSSSAAGDSTALPSTNAAPRLAPIGAKSVSIGSLLSFTVSTTDPDGDSVTYSVSGLPKGAFFSANRFTWTPGYDQAGRYKVTFTVMDGRGGQASETVTITVYELNKAPDLKL